MHPDIKRAYQLIQAGRKTEALTILKPVLQDEPKNIQAWWLVANALTDPSQTRHALERVLQLDPKHAAARQKLARMEGSTRSFGLPYLVIMAVLIAVVIVGIIFSLTREKDAENLPIPTRLAELAQVATGLTPTTTFTPTATVPDPATLPPAWTPTETFTPSITPTPSATQTATPSRTWTPVPTNTPPFTATPPPTSTATSAPEGPPPWPEIDPVLFTQTYWDGDGDLGMEDFARGGAYLRHFDLPVRVYWDNWISPIWTTKIIEAMALINSIVPIIQASDEASATMRIWVMDSSPEYDTYCGAETAACADIALQTDPSGQYVEARSWVRIRASSPPDTSMVIHEMMHAMGVVAHSPHPEDVMYRTYTQLPNGVRFSDRDLLILELLYVLPPLGAEFASPDVQVR
jgi:hypothetical protein